MLPTDTDHHGTLTERLRTNATPALLAVLLVVLLIGIAFVWLGH